MRRPDKPPHKRRDIKKPPRAFAFAKARGGRFASETLYGAVTRAAFTPCAGARPCCP